MSETLDINKNIWLWLTATKGISNYHSAFIDGSPDIDSWDEFPEFKNLVDNSDKFTSYQESVLTKGSSFLKNFIKASMYPLFCKELKDIQQPTTNQLHFNKGTLGDFGKANNSEVYSHCFTMAYSYEDFLNTAAGATFFGTCKYSYNNNGWFLYNNRLGNQERLFFFSMNGTTVGSHVINLTDKKPIKEFFDGTPKKFVVVRNAVNTRLYVDNVEIVKLSGHANVADDFLFKIGYLAGSTSENYPPFFKGKVSDVAVFNFDISAADAPYTKDDYQQGKPIPPYLLNGNTYFLDSTKVTDASVSGLGYQGHCEVSFVEGEGMVSELTSAGIGKDYIIPMFELPIMVKAGDIMTFELGQHTAVIDGVETELENFTSNLFFYKSSTAVVQKSNVYRKSNSSFDFVIEGEINRIGFSYEPKDASSRKDIYPFKIKVNGAELALENFTFDNKVLDYSGNNRNGTIRGVVEEPMTSRYGLGTLISILNLNPRFIELTKDDHNTYINNVSNIMVNKDLNLRPHLNALIKVLKDNESEVLSYVDNQGLADEYNGSTSDYEKLGFLFCALLKELRTIALEENLINY